jgi:hypothetical protein
MEFEITWVDPTLVVCRTSGVGEVKGYEEFLRAVSSSPEFGPDVSVLMDLTALDISLLTVTDMEELVRLRVRFAAERKARSAIVVGKGSPLKYGLGRMFEGLLASQLAFEIRVFEELDEAMAWLKADDANPAP